MPDSLERFTTEQMRALIDELAQDRDPNCARYQSGVAMLRKFFDPVAPEVAGALMRELWSRGHIFLCHDSILNLFASGFMHGWRGREALMEREELEASLGAVPDAAGTP